MKSKIALINFALSFSSLVMVDTDNTYTWVVIALIAWFVASALIMKHFFKNGLVSNI